MGHTADPRDQQAHLFGPYRAGIGPDSRAGPGRWSWTVFREQDPDEPVALGVAYDEGDAKNAVLDWARPRAPRTLKQRLRPRGHAHR